MKTSKYYCNWYLFFLFTIDTSNLSLFETLYGPGNTNLTSKTRSTAMRKALSFPRVCFTKRTGGDFRWIEIIRAGICVSVPNRPLILIKSEITYIIICYRILYSIVKKTYRRYCLHFVQRTGNREAFFDLRWFGTDTRVIC